MAFIPLHLYSGFSYLKSGIPVEKIAPLAKKAGYGAIGISDYMNLSGYAPFTHSCLDYHITPIYGMDLEIENEILSLFVQNERGYRNLLEIALKASRHEVSYALLKERQEGLAFVYDLEHSFLKEHYQEDDASLAETLFKRFKDFPRLYFGLPYREKADEYILFLREFSRKYSYPLVAFPHIAYIKKDDAIVTLITQAIQDHLLLDQKHKSGLEYFLSKEEIASFYRKEEIDLTEEIASSSFSFLRKRGTLLHYENDEGKPSEAYLKEQAYLGLKRLHLDEKKEYVDRLEYELSIIHKMGYDDYFLVVADYVSYAKTHGVSVGPGRGSGPASLVSYCLNISTIDPLEHGLLFERFLNPERSSMPDIDVDFSDVNRDIVVSYLQERYGKERVGHVLTSQTIGAKEALRDIGRVYGYADREISLIISTIQNPFLSLRDTYRQSKPFRDLVNSDPYYLEIVSLASKIEGLPRQAGLHAAGIILNDEPLEKAMPTKDEPGVGYVGCLEKDYLEEQGFLKMDLLGLRNLSTIDRCLELIKANRGISLTMEEIPYRDEQAISLIKNHEIIGLFQLESAGMQRAIDQVKPTTFEDIVALIALFRPGPMEQIPTYARRKNGFEKVTYLTPEIEDILSSTYGVIVYQEQIMQIAQKVASFSLGEADLFRRAISKKNKEKLASYKEKFVAGCLKNGKSQKLSEDLFELIFAFANYGFNKAHAVSYAVIACQMAYLKYNYPQEFYCAVLDSLSTSDPKFKTAISELKKHHIRLIVPSINASKDGFSVEKKTIRFPLSSIKSLQSSLSQGIYEEREENGPYQDMFDFAVRVKRYGLNLTNFNLLINAGALDEFHIDRGSLSATAYSALQYAEMIGGSSGMSALFDLGIEKPAIVSSKRSLQTDLDAEYKALGLTVSGSLLSLYEEEIKAKGAIPLEEAAKKERFLTSGVLKSVRAITTKKGAKMAFIEIFDDISEMSLVCFSETYDEAYPYLKEDNVLLVEGYLGQKGFVASKISPLGE